MLLTQTLFAVTFTYHFNFQFNFDLFSQNNYISSQYFVFRGNKSIISFKFNLSVLILRFDILMQHVGRLQAWTNLFRRARFFGRSVSLARPIGHARNGSAKPKCASDLETSGNIVFCSLLPK